MISIKIDSTAARNKFAKLPRVLDGIINLSLTQSVLMVRGKAKELSPYLTGNLRRSITHKIDKLTGEVFSSVVYARKQEYTNRRKPRGYMRPALNDNVDKIKNIFVSNFKKLS